MKLWERYLFGLVAKTFLFLLACIFLIYTIIDLSIHGVRFFSHGEIFWVDLLFYYVHNFANHIEFFFPLTLLLSSLKVLLDLNAHHELVALQMAGLSQKKLLLPFFAFAGILTLGSIANYEWFSPDSQEMAGTFRAEHKKRHKEHASRVFSIDLEDATELVYQGIQDGELFDVFWIKSSTDIWHMKYLNINGIPTGRLIDHFERNSNKKLEKTESFDHLAFPHLVLNPGSSIETFIPFENRSLSTLFKQSGRRSAERVSVLCYLHYKLATPLLSFLILIAVAPIAIRYQRDKPVFLIVALSLFALIGFMTILDGMFILGENQVLPSYLTIWGPFLLVLSLSIKSWRRKTL